jgi:hypothetical protein
MSDIPESAELLALADEINATSGGPSTSGGSAQTDETLFTLEAPSRSGGEGCPPIGHAGP